jgi:hypothetical protein
MALWGIFVAALGFVGLIVSLVNDSRWAHLICLVIGALVAMVFGGGYINISAGG